MSHITIKKHKLMEIQKLIERANQLLTEARYTSARIYTYNWLWKKGVLQYMEQRGLVEFNKEVGEECMLTFHDGGTVTFHHRDLIKSVDVLIHVLQYDNLGRRLRKPVIHPFRGRIGEYALEYLESLKRKGVSQTKTIPTYKRIISNFIEYLFSQGIIDTGGIDEEILARYIESREHRQREYIGNARRFLSYLYKRGLIDRNFSYYLSGLGKKFKRSPVPSFYSPEEIRRLEESISRSSSVGKRDYAMVVLCSRTGLRVSDVAYLSFDNIDWENNVISIVQYKTGNPLCLPLLPVVGNAIIDYLRYARPKSDSKRVFLSCRPPYGELTPGAVHIAIAVAFRDSGIEFGDRHHGGHALRFSLAQRMLDKSTPITVISEILGHTETDMTRTYVRIDLTHMRSCVLDVPETKDSFYTQRGGWLYE